MFKLQVISPNGRTAAVNVPKAYMVHLGWLMGQHIIIELLEDNTLWIRKPTSRDLGILQGEVVNRVAIRNHQRGVRRSMADKVDALDTDLAGVVR